MEYAACAIAIVTSPGTMKTSYSTPSTCLMRPPSESPNTRMNRNDEATGASDRLRPQLEDAQHLAPGQRRQRGAQAIALT